MNGRKAKEEGGGRKVNKAKEEGGGREAATQDKLNQRGPKRPLEDAL